MAEYKDIPTRLREATKRTDLPAGVLVLLSQAYEEHCEMERKIETLKRDLDATEGINGTLMIACDSMRKQRDEVNERISNIKEGFEGCCTACERVGEMNIRLRAERDEARREVMFWMSERSSTKEMTAEYKKRGWEYLREVNTTHYFCDMCANPIHQNDVFHYAEFPVSVGPVNAGESGTVCRECEKKIRFCVTFLNKIDDKIEERKNAE